MIQEITAKTLLSSSKRPDPWFGVKYTMNLYRGCQHQCIYCDSRSECYQIENFNDVLVKVNAVDLLRQELARKRVIGVIGTTLGNHGVNIADMHLSRIRSKGTAICLVTVDNPVPPAALHALRSFKNIIQVALIEV